jgi:transcriptional regulator with XRE-family HTH domain
MVLYIYYITRLGAGAHINRTELIGELLRRLRKRKSFSRGQLARLLKVTPTTLYNLETGRSRVKLGVFLEALRICGLDAQKTLAAHMFSIQTLEDLRPAEMVRAFRNRVKISQKDLAKRLGYSSAAMVHHFEKGIREPSVEDFFGMMELAGDNLRGLVHEITGDESFSRQFAAGLEAQHQDWQEYWSVFYISAIRQIMRTQTYKNLARFKPGLFADILGISDKEERHALEVLKRFNIIRWEKAKPHVDPTIKIAVPQNITAEILNGFKTSWLDYSRRRFLGNQNAGDLFSVDSLPANKELFSLITKRIRALQDEIHNMPHTESDGFISLNWLATFTGIG